MARLAIAAPRRIITIALFVLIGAAIFGIPVTKSLSAGGFQDPSSESVRRALRSGPVVVRLCCPVFGQEESATT